MAEKHEKISEETILQRRKEIAWRRIDDEALLINTRKDEMCHLNPVASFLWTSLDGALTLKEIARRLVKEYEVGEEQALEDLLEFAAELIDKGVAEIVQNSQT